MLIYSPRPSELFLTCRAIHPSSWDLIGPFEVSKVFSYIKTKVNRATWWVEVVPLTSISTDNVATAFS